MTTLDEHLVGLTPELVDRIRKAAAALVATAPPPNADQIKALSAIFKPTTAGRKAA
jgi:hypothetical protein